MKKNGRTRKITFASLSAADQDYIKSRSQPGTRGAAAFDATEGFFKRMFNRFEGMTPVEKKRVGIASVVVAVVNIPIYFFLWIPMFFKDFSSYWEALTFRFQPEIVSAMAVDFDKILIGSDVLTGRADLFALDGQHLMTITNPAATGQMRFAEGIAPVGTNHFMIGAPGLGGSTSAGDRNWGVAYLFDRSNTLIRVIDNPSLAKNDFFGSRLMKTGCASTRYPTIPMA